MRDRKWQPVKCGQGRFVVNVGYAYLDSYVLVTLNIIFVIELSVYFNDLRKYTTLQAMWTNLKDLEKYLKST